MTYINLELSNAAAITFLNRAGKVSDPIVIPADSTVTIPSGLSGEPHALAMPLGMERLILWTGAWALNGRPQPEPAWKDPAA